MVWTSGLFSSKDPLIRKKRLRETPLALVPGPSPILTRNLMTPRKSAGGALGV
jgi:hypothetical protein